MAYKSNISRLDRIQNIVDFPKVVLIDNCSACNLKCSMCDHVNIRNYRKVKTMDFDLYTKIIDEIALENPDARVWQIFFGDPFLCKDMPRRLHYAKDNGLTDVVLNSNGAMMTADKAKKYIDAGLDALYVGIDAFSPEVYSKIRVGGYYKKAVDNVLMYRDLLNQYGNDNQKLYVQFVECDLNEHEKEDFKDFWTGEGINVKIRPRISWAGLIEADNLHNNADVERKPCYWLMQTMNICADGRVAFCSVDIHCRVNCGDVKKDSLKKIWNSSLNKYREMHEKYRFEELPELCRNCSDWQSAYADFVINNK